MSKDRRKSDLLTPTAASVGFCLGGLFAALFFIVLPRLGGDTLLDLVFGKDASLSLINATKESYGPLLQTLLGNDLLGRAVVFGVWAFVGLVTFVLVSFISNTINSVEEQKRELDYVHQTRSLLIKNDMVLLVYRLGIAVIWALFVVISIRFVLSYFAVTGLVALGAGGLVDWGLFIIASLILFLALHVQVVLARLFVGRTRIF